jgi:cephalosporin-C deacetylase-like acetyl esterase
LPAVLSPHGHWPGGRFQDIEEPERRAELASGAERFDNAARHILQARAVQLARMGAVVFLYDMVGYADSVQIPQEIAHSARGRTRAGPDDGLFFSVRAELRLHSILGLQIWNAVRALDFLTALPDVDPARIAVTGASGGGTQTFLLAAIDDRPAWCFPP